MEGSVDNLDDVLSSISCLNDDECDVFEVDKLLVWNIANILCCRGGVWKMSRSTKSS